MSFIQVVPVLAVADAAINKIDLKTPALGQAAMAASSPVVIASDQSAVPVSVSQSVPVKSGTYKETVTPALVATTIYELAAANPNRKGFTVYNNSTNSLYLAVKNPFTLEIIDFLGSNAGPTSVVKWHGPLVYTGALYGKRNAGTGGAVVIEFE